MKTNPNEQELIKSAAVDNEPLKPVHDLSHLPAQHVVNRQQDEYDRKLGIVTTWNTRTTKEKD